MKTEGWFVYCPETGISFHDTKAEAVQMALDVLWDLTEDGIHENTGDLCYGRVHGHAICTEHTETPGGEYDAVEDWTLTEEEVDG